MIENLKQILNVITLTVNNKEEEAKKYISTLKQDDVINCIGILIAFYAVINEVLNDGKK